LAQRGEHIGFLSPIPAKPHAGYAVAEFLLEVLLVYVAIPAFSIAWVKSQRNRKMGRIALPSLASLRLSVRVWFFVLLLGFVGAMVSTLGADIAGWLGIKDVATMTNSFLWIGALLVVGGATPFALGWPAAALGEKLDRMGSMQLAAKAGVGSSLPGTILAILPFVLGFWGAVVLVGRVPGEQFRQMLYGPLFLVFLFLGTASWSTFVGRIYAYAKGEGPDATQLAPSPVSELP
jgi:hypothetical protein